MLLRRRAPPTLALPASQAGEGRRALIRHEPKHAKANHPIEFGPQSEVAPVRMKKMR